VDGLRNYPEEPEGRWYSERYRTEGDDRYDGYRVPDPRFEESRSWGSGPPAPPLAEEPERYQTQSIDRGPMHRSPDAAGLTAPPAPPLGPPGPPPAPMPPAPRGTGQAAGHGPGAGDEPGGAVYRTRRAGVTALLAGAAIFAELLLVRVLLVAEFGAKGTPGGVLAGLFALAGVPLVTIGLYGLATDAASAGPAPGRLWLRVPLAYLPVGLVLLLAAALAVR
jgi:hypothetical protein